MPDNKIELICFSLYWSKKYMPEIPEKMTTVIESTKLILFHSKSKEITEYGLPKNAMRLLSNFSMIPVEYESHIYPSVEHAYQAQKYNYSNRPELVSEFYDGTITTPEAAKSAGGKGGMKKRGAVLDFSRWSEDVSQTIMRELIVSKIQRNPVIREILDLLAPHHVELVHFSRSDMFWGAHVNEERTAIIRGKNLLGELYNEFIHSG